MVCVLFLVDSFIVQWKKVEMEKEIHEHGIWATKKVEMEKEIHEHGIWATKQDKYNLEPYLWTLDAQV